MKRLWVNRRFLNKRSWQIAGSVYAVIGLAGMLANLDELIFPSLACDCQPESEPCAGLKVSH